jgi:DNA-binding MarR family transcriptional regulator
MTDIVERIRGLRYVHVPVASQLMAEAAAEIERLRNGAAEGRETVTLTAEEREAVEFAICSLGRDDYLNERHAEQLQETLDRLLERLK